MLLENAKILVGDDSILARKQLKDVLTSFGAKNLLMQRTVRKRSINIKPKNRISYFLDIVMPVKDGIVAVQEIQNLTLPQIL